MGIRIDRADAPTNITLSSAPGRRRGVSFRAEHAPPHAAPSSSGRPQAAVRASYVAGLQLSVQAYRREILTLRQHSAGATAGSPALPVRPDANDTVASNRTEIEAAHRNVEADGDHQSAIAATHSPNICEHDTDSPDSRFGQPETIDPIR